MWLSFALASSVAPLSPDIQPIETPLGMIDARTVNAFCQAYEVVVGAVESVGAAYARPYETAGGWRREVILTPLTFRVERVFQGDPRETLVFGLPFGEVDGVRRARQDPGRQVAPDPVVGRRYLQAFSVSPMASADYDAGDPVAWAGIRLDDDAPLEAVAQTAELLLADCVCSTRP